MTAAVSEASTAERAPRPRGPIREFARQQPLGALSFLIICAMIGAGGPLLGEHADDFERHARDADLADRVIVVGAASRDWRQSADLARAPCSSVRVPIDRSGR
ncbi:MAG: hypothetical protein K0R61_2465 [Microvirga sp.]|nr:hypothetical protein [Microvirga sp.]